MRENVDQKNSEYGHISRSVKDVHLRSSGKCLDFEHLHGSKGACIVLENMITSSHARIVLLILTFFMSKYRFFSKKVHDLKIAS